MTRVHAFGDDALGEHDAVALAQLVKDGAVSPQELAAAAIARAQRVDPQLHAVTYPLFDAPRYAQRLLGQLVDRAEEVARRGERQAGPLGDRAVRDPGRPELGGNLDRRPEQRITAGLRTRPMPLRRGHGPSPGSSREH